MPLSLIPSTVALENAKCNPANSWPNRSAGENRVEPICKPTFQPSFTLVDRESVFTIGSCFARNVEYQLELLGFDVPMRRLEVVTEYEGSAENNPNIFNNYAVPSILNELQWALDPKTPFDPDTCLLEVTSGKYCDLHLTRLLKAVDLKEAIERRRRIQASMSKVKDCRVVIITLGLIEAWYDVKAGRYLNIAPPRTACAREPERFQLHVLRYDEVIDCLRRVMKLLKKFCRKDQRVVLTVSPVPLGLTFTDQDVIVANSYSKSVLRAAAQEITVECSNIDYFPSYESVLHSDRMTAWQDDMRHVTPEVIAENVGRMVAAYTGRPTASAKVDEALGLEKQRSFAKAAALYEEALAELPHRTDLKLRLARCLVSMGDLDRAERLIEPMVTDPDRGDEAYVALAQVKRLQGDLAAHHEMFERLLEIKRQSSVREAMIGSFEAREDKRTLRACDVMAELAPTAPMSFEYRARVAQRRRDYATAEAVALEGLSYNQALPAMFALLGEVQLELGKVTLAEDAFRRALELNPRTRAAQRGLERLSEAKVINPG